MLALAKNRSLFAGSLLLSLGFVFQEATPFFLSMGSILIGASALFPPYSRKIAFLPLAFAVLWLFGLFSGFYSSDSQEWSRIVTRQLALVLLPLAVLSGARFTGDERRRINLSWISLSALFACISLFRYLLHKEAVDAALLHSGAVPVWDGVSWPWELHYLTLSKFVESGVNHIYFSLIQAAAILCCFEFYKREKRTVWLVLGLVHLISIHWFLARTGLLALYGALAVMLVYYLLHSRKKGLAIGLLVAGLSMPVLSYVLLEPVRNKVKNSMEDIEAVQGQRNINHRSLAMRLEAWKTAWSVIKKHPMGVGAGDAQASMQNAYEERNSPLWKENRIPPHNQYLETALAVGLPAAILLVLMLIFNLVASWKEGSLLGIGISVALFVSLFFESLLQTQLGICLFPFLLLFVAGSQARDEPIVAGKTYIRHP